MATETTKPWYVYVVCDDISGTGNVYTGCTNRPQHRLEAHRGRRSGGARRTSQWATEAQMVILIGPLIDDTGKVRSKSLALSFERAYKLCRAGPCGGIRGRCLALYKLLHSPTGKIGRQVVLRHCLSRMRIKTVLTRTEFAWACTTATVRDPVLSVKLFEFGCPRLP